MRIMHVFWRSHNQEKLFDVGSDNLLVVQEREKVFCDAVALPAAYRSLQYAAHVTNACCAATEGVRSFEPRCSTISEACHDPTETIE